MIRGSFSRFLRQSHRIRDRGHLRSPVIAVLLVFTLGIGMGLDRVALQFVGVDAQSNSTLTDLDNFSILEDTYNLIRENYVLSDDISDEDLIYGASRGMVDSLGDTGHSTFLDPEEAKQFEQSSRGELIGIGITIDTTQSPPVVILPIQDSPAFKAGIKAGDVILTVDGTDTSDLESPEDVGNLIRGEEGTDVTIELRHASETESYEVTITRSRIVVDPISWIMLPGDVMWLRVSEFSSGAADGVKEALVAGKKAGASSVLLDLRGNPGGLVVEALGIGSQFLPGGSILYQDQDTAGETKEVKTVGDKGEWQEGPLVVLIDENSASASEIVSSSIKDNERGVLVGQTTFGTGTVLLPYDLEDGSIVLLGVSLWLTADGDQIYKAGVEPNEDVANPEGVGPVVPYLYEGDALSQADYDAITDEQLKAGYDRAIKESGN